VDETAEEVSAAGGRGIAVVCDHTVDEQVRELFAQVQREQGRLDLLVANAWGGYLPYAEHMDWFTKPFWEQSMDRWDGMFTAGLRSHLSTSRYGLPLLRETGPGLLVLTTFTRGKRYLGNMFYDLAKNAVPRLVTLLADELIESEVSVVGLSPGWVAVERMTGLDTKQQAEMESPSYTGRAVLALKLDPAVGRRSGQTLAVGDVARAYGFTDLDGRQPTPYIIEP
jgi:NAD(P)-dependent dehydrogenase (short-subunit alcohol dehydrogenase family)